MGDSDRTCQTAVANQESESVETCKYIKIPIIDWILYVLQAMHTKKKQAIKFPPQKRLQSSFLPVTLIKKHSAEKKKSFPERAQASHHP